MMLGSCSTVSVIDRPFRRDRRPRDGLGGDGDRFGYRVALNGLVGQKQQGRIDPSGRLKLARGVLAVTVDGRGLDAEPTRDLFGVQVRVDEAKALALALRQAITTARHIHAPRLEAT